MNKIFIIGGGFGGLSAARRLCKSGLGLDVTVIDRKEGSDFLPTLPDCLGRGIEPQYLSYRIDAAAGQLGFKFINEEVISVNTEKREISTKGRVLNYDFLMIASGSETNFYGNENIRTCAYKLDDARDVKVISEKLKENRFETYIVGGGGYTGIEVATNLRVFLDKNNRKGKVIVVERAPSILGPLPEWMKGYVSANLKKLDVEVFTNSQIEKIEDKKVYIAAGKVFDNAAVIWAAGVKTAGFIQNLAVKKNPQGRIITDEYLKIEERCFVVGDASNFSYQGAFLRMAVQFAIAQGECAAQNIINCIKGKSLKKYRPVDFGYIIPMANNRSCGNVFGLNLKGFLPTALHFMMCLYRSWGVRNKFGIIKGLVK